MQNTENKVSELIIKPLYFILSTVILAAIIILVVGHVETKKHALERKIYACWNCEKRPSVFEIKNNQLICVECGRDNVTNINEWLKLKRKARRNLDQSS